MKLFYYGVGNPFHPSEGTDVVLRDHLFETAGGSPAPVARITVRDPAEAPEPGSPFADGEHLLFVPDRLRQSSRSRSVGQKIRHVLHGRPLMTIVYASRDAERQFVRDLATDRATFVVDHFHSWTNMPFWRVVLSRHRFVYICHDFTAATLVDAAALSRSRLRKVSKLLQSVQVFLSECVLVAKADRVVFISSADRARFAWLCRGKSETLNPLLEHGKATATVEPDRFAQADLGSCAVFVGSPRFPPNAFAIDWLVNRLGPALREAGSPVSVLVVGKGTEGVSRPGDDGVRGLGFVSDGELRTLLDRCLCSLSPVIHGGGLKIKLSEAFAAGCPVVATPQSLKGFMFLDESPTIDIEDPAGTVALLDAMVAEADGGRRRRAAVRERWAHYRRGRVGRLRQVVDGLARESAR